MYSQKWNCALCSAASIFPKQNYNVLSPNSYTQGKSVRDLYIPGSVCLFCCSQICEPILEIYKSLTDTWLWKLGMRPRNSQKKKYKYGIFVAVQYYCCRAFLEHYSSLVSFALLKHFYWGPCGSKRIKIKRWQFVDKSIWTKIFKN
jgi:hypothetical protein